jgi:hypothetical protein
MFRKDIIAIRKKHKKRRLKKAAFFNTSFISYDLS